MTTELSLSNETHNIISLCWDTCFQYDFARAELLESCDELELLLYLDVPSVSEDIVGVALRNATTEYFAASPEKVSRLLTIKQRSGMEGFGDAGDGRISFRGFSSLLGPLALVANAVHVLKERYAAMLKVDRLLADCIGEETKTRNAVFADEGSDYEKIVSAMCRWRYTQEFRDQLQKGVEMAQRRSAADKGIEKDRLRISLMRRETLEKEENSRRDTQGNVQQLSRLVAVETTMTALHEQFAVAQAYEAASLALQRDEQMDLLNQIDLLCSERSLLSDRMDQLEWQLGIVGRFAVGFSIAHGGIRGHDAVLRRMKESGSSDDFTWLLESLKDKSMHLNANNSWETPSKSSQLQHCVLDPSYYKLPSNEYDDGMRKIPSLKERCEIEASLQTAFSLLTRLNYAVVPHLQKYASTLDKLVLYPVFELFVTQCGMRVIGSKQLAFMKSATSHLDSKIIEVVRPLVPSENRWILQYGLGYDDFIGFLVDQAAVENVQCAYMLRPKVLLRNLVKNIIEPKWIQHYRQEVASGTPVITGSLGSSIARPFVSTTGLSCAKGSRDLCLLLNTALSWLRLASISTQEYALAYRKQVLQYDFATRPNTEQDDYITTTKVLLPTLFSHSNLENTLQVRCDRDSLEALRQCDADTEFTELSATVGMDGSLDAVTAWLSLAIDKISREDLLSRIADTVDCVLRESISGMNFLGKTNIIHSTPISWILTLPVCAALAFDDEGGIIPRLDKFFRSIVLMK